MSSEKVVFFRKKSQIKAEKAGDEDEDEEDDTSSSGSSLMSDEDREERDERGEQGAVQAQGRCRLREHIRETLRKAQGAKQTFSLTLVLAHSILDELGESNGRQGDWTALVCCLKALQKGLETILNGASGPKKQVLESSIERLRMRLEVLFEDPATQSRDYKSSLRRDQARALNVCHQLHRKHWRDAQRSRLEQRRRRKWSMGDECLRTSIEAKVFDPTLTIICLGIVVMPSTASETGNDEAVDINETLDGKPDILALGWDDVEELTICGDDRTWYMCLTELAMHLRNVKQLRFRTHAGTDISNDFLNLPPTAACMRSLVDVDIDRVRNCQSRNLSFQLGLESLGLKDVLERRDRVDCRNKALPSLRALCVIRSCQELPLESRTELFRFYPKHINALVKATYVCVSCQSIISPSEEEVAAMVARGDLDELVGPNRFLLADWREKKVAALESSNILPPLYEGFHFVPKRQRHMRTSSLDTDDAKHVVGAMAQSKANGKPVLFLAGRGHWLVGEPSHWADWRFCRRCALAHLNSGAIDGQGPHECRCLICRS